MAAAPRPPVSVVGLTAAADYPGVVSGVTDPSLIKQDDTYYLFSSGPGIEIRASADLTRLPYADACFDAIVCGWVLEHLPDPRPGLSELARVMRPGARLLLLVTEDTLTGSMCSRMWHCRTHNRAELRRICQECGLRWQRPLWFTRLHRLLRLGGIIAELTRE